MAGAALDGELTTPAVVAHKGVRFALVTPADDAAIRRLLRDSPMRGAVSVAFEREPDYFAGEGLASATDKTLLAFLGERLVSMGRCSTRAAFLNGEPRRVGYLAELRLDATVGGRFDILRQGYRVLRELEAAAPADFYFTSIASDNDRARQLLERGLPGLPRYDFLAEFVTLLIPVAKSDRESRVSLEPATPGELADFFNAAARHYQLPAPGATLAHAFLSPFAVEPGVGAPLPDFVAAFFPLAARSGLEFLTLGFQADDARLDLLRRRFRCREFRSRLYRVGLTESAAEPDGRPFLPEVALL